MSYMLPWRSGWKIRGTYDGGGVSGPAGRGRPGGAEAVIVQAMLDPSLSAEAFSLVLEEDAEKNRERWVEHVCEQK